MAEVLQATSLPFMQMSCSMKTKTERRFRPLVSASCFRHFDQHQQHTRFIPIPAEIFFLFVSFIDRMAAIEAKSKNPETGRKNNRISAFFRAPDAVRNTSDAPTVAGIIISISWAIEYSNFLRLSLRYVCVNVNTRSVVLPVVGVKAIGR